MSRLKNFSRNLASSYLQLAVNIVYSLISVPLILHWLPRAEFGLWALLVQMMTYASLLDLGMTAAAGRLFVDHKDDRKNGKYGSLFQISFFVSLAQATLLLVVFFSAAPLLATLLKIPENYQNIFIHLLRIQCFIVAINFSTRPLQMVLYAQQRMDIIAYKEMFNLLGSLGLLVLFLTRGHGIFSFVWANAIITVTGPAYLIWNCQRLGFFPKAREWGKRSWKSFMEVFNVGKNLFLMDIGAQLINASQIIIVSRTLGLEAAAVWSVGTKAFNLFIPLMCRPFGAALPGLYEMVARDETARLKKRFKEIVVLTGSLGIFLGVAFALCNSLFVHVWTNGKINWSPGNDILLGLLIFILSLQTTQISIVNLNKEFHRTRYIYFLEGACFVITTLSFGYRWGILGILALSNLCTLLFSYQYGIRLASRYFHCSPEENALVWIKPCLKLGFILIPLAALLWYLTIGLSELTRLIIHGFAIGIIGGILFLRIGFPREMIHELVSRLPHPWAKLLKLLSR